MAATTPQSYHDTIEEARAEVRRWRDGGFTARHKVSGKGYCVWVGSLGDRYHKMKRKRKRKEG